VPTNSAPTFADGMACRDPHPDAIAVICRGAADIVRVTEDEIAEAMRILYEATHNIAEGAGAAALAALLKDGLRRRGGRFGIILSGGNVDRPVFAKVLAGGTPEP
jgi:threonine dehydratase